MQEDIYDGWSEGTPGSVDRWMTAFHGPLTSGRPLDEVVVHRYNSELYEFYHCFDPQCSTIAILGHDGLVRERVDYSAFGFAQHRPFADIDGDGIGSDDDIVSDIVNQCNGGTAVPIGNACYTAEADINRDGVIDYVSSSSDYALAGTRSATLAPGEISAVHNIFGWNGAVFDAEGSSNGLYLMRMRHYSPVRQRWLQRDPAGYMDSANLYGYVAGNPIGTYRDSFAFEASCAGQGCRVAARQLRCWLAWRGVVGRLSRRAPEPNREPNRDAFAGLGIRLTARKWCTTMNTRGGIRWRSSHPTLDPSYWLFWTRPTCCSLIASRFGLHADTQHDTLIHMAQPYKRRTHPSVKQNRNIRWNCCLDNSERQSHSGRTSNARDVMTICS